MGTETQLGQANIPIRATLDKLDADLEGARSKVGKVIDGIVGNVQKVGGIALGIGGAGIGAIGGIGAAVGKMAIDAAPVEGLAAAFDGLNESAGDDMLAALKKGSAGMIANRDLMLSFNQAASLVSLEFAQELPDAMQYLTKVQASTGQDMGFLLDSLVKGVGRLSPMILDNLSIQVSQAEATERAAQMFGVEADQLTKTQLQAGMMNVTLEKLAENTAAMPDVSKSAAAQMAQLKATFQDTKDEVGLAFLPVLSTLMGTLGELAEKFLPMVTQALDYIAPIAATVAAELGMFFDVILNEGVPPLEALQVLLEGFFPPEVAEQIVGGIRSVVEWIGGLVEAVAPYVEMAMQWIGQNVQLSDALIALGIAIASVVLPALWGIISPILVIVGVAIGLIAVITLLRAAWESDFLGIRTALLDAWDQIQPALAELWEWLKINVPAAIETLVTFWQETLQPALAELWEWLAVNVPAAIETLVAFWEETLLPAIEAVWAFIQADVIPLLEALGEVIGATLVLAGTALAGLWQNVLLPALQTAGTWIRDTLGPILESFLGWLNNVTGGLDGVKSALSTVKDWLGKVADKISSIKLPDWLTPGSPTPFEIGLVGIGDAARRLATIEFPGMAAALSVPQFAAAGMGAGEMVSAPRGGPAGGYQITNIFEANSVRSEEDIYRLNEEMDRSMALRGLQRNIG